MGAGITPWKLALEGWILVAALVELGLETRQYCAIARGVVPPGLQAIPGLLVSHRELVSVRQQQTDRKLFDLIDTVIRTILLLLFYQLDVFVLGWRALRPLGPFAAVAVFALVYSLCLAALKLPSAYCKQFVLLGVRRPPAGQLAAFLRKTCRELCGEGLLLLGAGLLSQAALSRAPDALLPLSWLGGLSVLAAQYVLKRAAAGRSARPLGPSPKEQVLLRDAEALSRSLSFPLGSVLLDDRRRAAFVRLCRLPRKHDVAFRASLLEVIDVDELLSLFCQKLAHWFLYHGLQALCLRALIVLNLTTLLALTLCLPGLGAQLGLGPQDAVLQLFMCWQLRRPVTLLARALQNWLSRRHVTLADKFVVEHGRGLSLITALTKLKSASLELVEADPLHAFFHSRHPTLSQRVLRILAGIRREEKV